MEILVIFIPDSLAGFIHHPAIFFMLAISCVIVLSLVCQPYAMRTVNAEIAPLHFKLLFQPLLF